MRLFHRDPRARPDSRCPHPGSPAWRAGSDARVMTVVSRLAWSDRQSVRRPGRADCAREARETGQSLGPPTTAPRRHGRGRSRRSGHRAPADPRSSRRRGGRPESPSAGHSPRAGGAARHARSRPRRSHRTRGWAGRRSADGSRPPRTRESKATARPRERRRARPARPQPPGATANPTGPRSVQSRPACNPRPPKVWVRIGVGYWSPAVGVRGPSRPPSGVGGEGRRVPRRWPRSPVATASASCLAAGRAKLANPAPSAARAGPASRGTTTARP